MLLIQPALVVLSVLCEISNEALKYLIKRLSAYTVSKQRQHYKEMSIQAAGTWERKQVALCYSTYLTTCTGVSDCWPV